jgi:hypothetical protein
LNKYQDSFDELLDPKPKYKNKVEAIQSKKQYKKLLDHLMDPKALGDP